jgi:hypothetical protein
LSKSTRPIGGFRPWQKVSQLEAIAVRRFSLERGFFNYDAENESAARAMQFDRARLLAYLCAAGILS